MVPKLAVFLVTFIVNIAVGVVIILFMLIAMNGYSESDAMWGLGIYVLLAMAVGLIASLGSVLLTRLLIKKQYRPAVSVLLSAAAFSIIGIVLETICSMIGVGVAEIVRVSSRIHD